MMNKEEFKISLEIMLDMENLSYAKLDVISFIVSQILNGSTIPLSDECVDALKDELHLFTRWSKEYIIQKKVIIKVTRIPYTFRIVKIFKVV